MNDGEGNLAFAFNPSECNSSLLFFFSVIDFAPELVFSPIEGIYEATKSSAYFP